MYKKLLLILSFFYLSTSAFSQGHVFQYARQVVDTMASESMHGRGYVNDGDKIAASYLNTEFQKIGLKSFQEDYYQKFTFPINTIPFVFSFNCTAFKRELILGKDYIVSASSCSSELRAPMSKVLLLDSAIYFSPKKLKSFLKKVNIYCFVAVDLKKVSDAEIVALFTNRKKDFRGLIFLKRTKLTHTCSQKVDGFPSVQLFIPDSINIQQAFKKCYADLHLTNKFNPNHQSQNVIGFIPGAVYPDSFIVFSAHYDHLGQMGSKVYFPGANDNASGCAMLLNLAKYYSLPENKPKYSIAFIAFAGEEVGLLGSDYFTKNPLFPLTKIKFVFNMDIMGTGEEGITVVNGSVFKTEFDKLKQINSDNKYIKDVKIRGKAANSDHYHFSEKGVKAFFIYTMGGIKAYHDIYDRPETLPLNEFENLFKLITQFGSYLQN
jgi:aminopeptidase YwaD